jgi:hypothetical protein
VGGGKGGGNTTTSSFKPPEAFMKAYKESLNMARDAVDQPYRQYQGDLVAGLTPTQRQGIANVNAAQGMALPAIQQGMQYTQQAAKGITPQLYERFYSPYVRDVADATQANLLESGAQQMSSLKGGAINAGAFGGDRGGVAQAEMARQQQLANAMSMSNIYNQGYGQAMGLAGQQVANRGAMGQQLAALGAGAQGSVLQGAQAQMAAGAQQQATKQAELQAAYQQWMQKQAYPYQQAQFFANIAQGLGAGAGGTSSTTAPAPNMYSQIFGGLGAIGSIFSDKRLKENIQAVGKLNDGQTIYRYNFKGDPKTQIGLLAQEVEETKPDAVTQVKGLKMVNYKDATEDAANSMGGVVSPSMGREGLAGGGVPFYPFEEAEAYVPEGKINVRSATIPSAPKSPSDEGLGEGWAGLKPLTQAQASGLRGLAADVGLELPVTKAARKYDEENPPDYFGRDALLSATGRLSPMQYASGGVAARKHYQDGGMEDVPVEEEGLAAAPAPEVVIEPPAGLVASESGGDFSARNPQGYVGRLQFGPERLIDAKRAGVIPAEMTSEDFRLDPEAQKATEQWHLGDINDFIDKSGLGAVEGKTIKGVPVTRAGLVNVAHLGGKGGLQKFVSSGGRYDPADANGTRLSDYLAMASNTGVAAAEPASGEGEPVEAPQGADGYVIPGEKSPSGLGRIFDAKKIFASEESPSVIERIMGRRLSPEARSAVMNASFALMAGRSPFFFSNLGEAGRVGAQTYYNALQQSKELAATEAELGLTRTGKETERMNAATARINAARQLYAQMLPQIRFWQMRNPGQPLPPEYRRVIEAAYPSEGPAGLVNAPGLTPQLAPQSPSVPPSAGGAAAAPAPTPAVPPPASGEMPAPDGTETVAAPSTSGNSELDKLYEQLPNEMNPNYWNRMAQNAMTPEDYTRASQRAAELTQQYMDKGIPLPSGRVPFPGTYEMQTEQDLRKLQTEGAYKATSEQNQRAQANIQSFQNASGTLTQAAENLAATPTGQFSEVKSNLVTALNALGVPQDAAKLEQASNIQELRKTFSRLLFEGDLKGKIGSQISGMELQMFSRGFGDVNLEPGANRYIVGTMRGILEMEQKRARDWLAYADSLDRPISSRDIAKWEAAWNDENLVGDYIKKGIANTPAAGEINWQRWNSDPQYRDGIKFTEGYQYVMPDGGVKVYTGNPEDRFFLPVDQYQEAYGGGE